MPTPFASPLPSLLALDLELSPKTGALQAAGWVWDGQARAVGADEGLQEVLSVLKAAQHTGAALVGHNIRRFDLPHLWQLSRDITTPEVSSEAQSSWPHIFSGPVIDTLEVSALVWPGKPSHRLDKLYRQQTSINDPVADCHEALEVLMRAQQAAQQVSPALRYWWQLLLPAGPLRALLLGEFQDEPHSEWRSSAALSANEAASDLIKVLGPQAAQRLWAYLSGLPTQHIDNLGALAALHWQMRQHEAVHRFPTWAARQWPTFGQAQAAAQGENDISAPALRAELKAIYGPDYDFRQGQLELIEATLAGRTVPLGLLPTGGGKSLTFQFPALLLSRRERALSVIMSPLSALMEDQVLSWQAQLPAYAERLAYLSAAQSPEQQREVLEGVWEGRVDILYLSPERLRNPGIQRLLRHRRPALWVLDEAHTLSQWGIDFRPDFLRVAQHISAVHEGGPPPLLSLLTATATARVLDDLQTYLIAPLAPLLQGRELQLLPKEPPSPWRSNIATQMVLLEAAERLPAARADLLANLGGTRVGIVYVRSRKLAQEYAAQLSEGGELRAAAFHARIPADQKREILRQFKAGELDVVVATSAFGMGIDRAGIHTVIHMGAPNTAESYLQEIGRVARQKGETGRAILYWSEKDFALSLRQDAEIRIGRDSLKKCWIKAKPYLQRPAAQRWISSQEFEGPLGISNSEELLTQTRVALRALESYGLLYEGQNQPAELLLRLQAPPEGLEAQANTLGTEGRRLFEWLQAGAQQYSHWQHNHEVQLDIMEVALLAALTPQGVIQAARQLVAAQLAQWSYRVTLRFRARRRTRLELVRLSLRTLLNQWRDYTSDSGEPPDLGQIDAEQVQADLSTRNKQATFDLARLGLRVLGLAHTRKTGARWSITPTKDAPPLSEWAAYTEARLSELSRIWTELEARRVASQQSDNLTLNMAELDSLTESEPLLGGASLPSFGPLESLLALENMGILDVARGDEAASHIFRLEAGTQTQYSRVIYEPLQSHYADRTRRIHVMRLLVQQESEEARQKFIEDYFALPLSAFCERYYPQNPEELTVAQLPGTKERILGGLSDVQRRVVEDSESRALLVLAGPGSGKTRTIVHRAAALLALEHVPPEQLLILAYNRTAVAEIRTRIAALLSPLGLSHRPLVLTFHGLARYLTGMRAGDAPDSPGPAHEKADRDNGWLLGQLINYLQENEVSYRYILVDEYQDIDAQKYEIVRLLAQFRAARPESNTATDTQTDSPAQGAEDPLSEDQNEQQSYLVAVGDDDQNIYGFQGASIRYIQQFRDDYQLGAAQQLCLIENYRSSPEIVAFSNAFVTGALAQHERLKGPAEAIYSRVPEAGKVGFCYYQDPYDAAYTVAHKIRLLAQKGTPLHEMAVLAPTWKELRAFEHLLRDLGLPSQHLDASDDLRPASSLLGRHLIRQLDDAPSRQCANPAATLLHLCQPYSPQDSTFAALQAAVSDLPETTYEVMAMRLRTAKFLKRGAVALSTFHSAKGSEFEQVFVLDSDPKTRLADLTKQQDATRALYVALTRAKRGLFVLSPPHKGHPLFEAQWLQRTLRVDTIPTASVAKLRPTHIHFTDECSPHDLHLSHIQVVLDKGRQCIDRYAQEWGNLTLEGNKIISSRGVVAVLSLKKRQELDAELGRGATIHRVSAKQIMYCERDNNWYPLQYTGPEQGHFLVLPVLEMSMPLGERAYR